MSAIKKHKNKKNTFCVKKTFSASIVEQRKWKRYPFTASTKIYRFRIPDFYLPTCLGQETAKGPFGLRVKLPPVYHTRRRLHTVPLIVERQEGKLCIPIFIVFGLTRPGIEPESTASVADALSTRPLILRLSTASNGTEARKCRSHEIA